MARVTDLSPYALPWGVRGAFEAKPEATGVAGPYVIAAVDSFTAGPVKMDSFSAGPATQKMGNFTSGPVASEDK